MTLLESLVALVILGLAATGFLETFQQMGKSTHDAAAWSAAVAYAEEGGEAAKLGSAVLEESQHAPPPSHLSRRVEVFPWRGKVEEIRITVTMDDGRSLIVHRLVDTR